MLKMHNRSIAIFAGYKNQQVVSLIKYLKVHILVTVLNHHLELVITRKHNYSKHYKQNRVLHILPGVVSLSKKVQNIAEIITAKSF